MFSNFKLSIYILIYFYNTYKKFTYSNIDLLNITYTDSELQHVDKFSDNSIKVLNRQVQITNRYKTKNGISSIVVSPHNNQVECEIAPKVKLINN